MPSHRLLNYIRRQLASGETEDVIAHSLRAVGWSEDEIRNALASIKERSGDENGDIPEHDASARGSKKLPIIIFTGLLGMSAGILLKTLDVVHITWALLALCIATYLAIHWFICKKDTRYGVALLVTVLALIGASLLFGIFSSHASDLPRVNTASSTSR